MLAMVRQEDAKPPRAIAERNDGQERTNCQYYQFIVFVQLNERQPALNDRHRFCSDAGRARYSRNRAEETMDRHRG
jgi:hypothetical protein